MAEEIVNPNRKTYESNEVLKTMNDQHLIVSHWRKVQKIFDANLATLRKQLKSAAMHDIRVAIKKLRAFWKLYNLLKKEAEGKNLLNKTEELFDILGREQDIETCMELIPLYEKENNCRYNELTQYLKLQLGKAKGWVRQAIRAYHTKELLKISSMLKEDERLKDEKKLILDIQDIVNIYLLEMKDYFKRPHKVRQKLKHVYYWVSILPKDMVLSTPDATKLHDIADELGEWQNNEVLFARAGHFRKDYLPKPFDETASIKMLEEKIKTKNEKLRKSALNKVRTLLKKVPTVKS